MEAREFARFGGTCLVATRSYAVGEGVRTPPLNCGTAHLAHTMSSMLSGCGGSSLLGLYKGQSIKGRCSSIAIGLVNDCKTVFNKVSATPWCHATFHGRGDFGVSAAWELMVTCAIPPRDVPIPTQPFYGQGDLGVSAARRLCLSRTIPPWDVPIPKRPFHGRGDSSVSAAWELCLTRAIRPRDVPIPGRSFHGRGDFCVSAARVVSDLNHTPMGRPNPCAAVSWPGTQVYSPLGRCVNIVP